MKRDSGIEVVIVTHNSSQYIGPCVDSILAARALAIIVDNGSTDDTVQIVRSHSPELRIITTGENLGYGRAMNLGFKETKGHFVILANPDVVFLDDSIRQLVGFLEKNPRIGVSGPQQMFPNRSWQRSYGNLPGIWAGIKDAVGITTLHNAVRRIEWPREVDRKPKEVPYLDGAVLAVRREAFLEMGGFDEDFFFYSEESDFCARLGKAGWRVMFFPNAKVIHARGASSVEVDRSELFLRQMVKSQSLLARKHLQPWRARIYTKLQICHFMRLALSYHMLKWFRGKESSDAQRIWMFNAYIRIWKEFSLCPQLMCAPTPDEKSNKCKELERLN